MLTAPKADSPFHSSQPSQTGTSIYHNHPLCRVGQGVPAESRIVGEGVGRQQCPFCFLLGEFETNREIRKQQTQRVAYKPVLRQKPPEGSTNAQSLRQLQSQSSTTSFRNHH